MLAPTPVSALVHSSTLVTAGVYLLFRFGPSCSYFVLWAGLLTTLFAGLSCLFESDIKKVIALSTLRQLGIIFSSLGLGCRSLAFAHLNLHASFKALLFMVVGTVIHGVYGSQEARLCTVLWYSAPWLFLTISLVCLSMCGLVFMSGWASKDAILECSYNLGFPYFSLLLYYLGICLTVGYCYRLLFRFSYSNHCDSPCSCSLPLSGLVRKVVLWLLLCRTVQGVLLSSFSGVRFVGLAPADKLFLLVLVLVSVLCSHLVSESSTSFCGPFSLISSWSGAASSSRLLIRAVTSTEHSLAMGWGFRSFPRLVA